MITVHIEPPAHFEQGKLQGFLYFWAKYVTGFDPSVHCQKCLVGKPSKRITSREVKSGTVYEMDEYPNHPYLYLCGMPGDFEKNGKEKNFHLPLRPKTGGSFSKKTYNGYTVTVNGAEELPIPQLPDDFLGSGEVKRRHARCKNFQFGIAYLSEPRT